MNKINFFAIILLTFLFACCQNDDFMDEKPSSGSELFIKNTNDSLRIKFANALIPALADSKELRELIKNEALKQFDNDHDVLYHLIKDQKINNISVSELISSYSESKELFNQIEEQLPLLTILIPTLPNFTPNSWATEKETPIVAVVVNKSKDVLLYDSKNNLISIPEGTIPNFPTLVVKTNERVRTSKKGNLKSSTLNSYSYEFIDDCFNPQKTKQKLKSSSSSNSFDPAAIKAFNLGMDWQRDHIYYGLTPQNTTGKFKSNYSEFFTDFQMNGDWFNKISEQSGDPFRKEKIPAKDATNPAKYWTDGAWEFQVTVIINSKNGMGSTLTKYFSAKPLDLIDYEIRYAYKNKFPYASIVGYKHYNPNLELIPWDLQNYGMAWKFEIAEIDSEQEVTETVEISSNYAMNFGANNGDSKKIGLKFGASAAKSQKSTCTIKTKLQSDDLGEAILHFNDPVITKKVGTKYYPREITAGWCKFSIKTKRVY
ncbi:MAG: hypothetical protein ACEPOZ_17140 [Marinifilaceae bacterium]